MRRVSSSVLLGIAVLPSHAGAGHAAEVTIGANRAVLVDGEPFLPIMQWLQCGSLIAHQKTLGINTFVGNGCSADTTADFLATCQTEGVYGVVGPDDPSFKDHPALLGWIFGDEPDLESNQVEPSTILAQYNAIKTADPGHPTFLTLTAGFYSEFDPPAWMGGDRSRYAEYCQASDLVGFDIYPVYGWCQPDWLGRVGAAQEELGTTYAPGVATYQWIECVKTSSQWCDLTARGADDGPYPEEVRNEVWQALIHGATAIGYFTHSWECPGYSQFCVTPEQEAELTRTNGQVTALTRPLLAPAYAGGVTVAVEGGGRVDAMVRAYEGKAYVFAVSLERQAVQASFTVPGLAARAGVEVYDEARTVTAAGETFADTFDALAVHVYVADLAGAVADGGMSDGPASDRDGAPADAPGATDGSAGDAAGNRDLGGGCGCRGGQAPGTFCLGALAALVLAAARARRLRRCAPRSARSRRS